MMAEADSIKSLKQVENTLPFGTGFTNQKHELLKYNKGLPMTYPETFKFFKTINFSFWSWMQRLPEVELHNADISR